MARYKSSKVRRHSSIEDVVELMCLADDLASYGYVDGDDSTFKALRNIINDLLNVPLESTPSKEVK